MNNIIICHFPGSVLSALLILPGSQIPLFHVISIIPQMRTQIHLLHYSDSADFGKPFIFEQLLLL